MAYDKTYTVYIPKIIKNKTMFNNNAALFILMFNQVENEKQFQLQHYFLLQQFMTLSMIQKNAIVL